MRTKEQTLAIDEEMEELKARNGTVLEAADVVKKARSKKSAMHDEFDWNDSTAAHQHRLDQARSLIRVIRVESVVHKKTISTVKYVRHPDLESGYVSTVDVAKDADLAHGVLVDEFKRAAAALRRARELAIVFSMEGEVDAATETIDLMRTRVESRVPGQ